jgi:BirA family transcriptional regulator, biotin operon repressor / biotin---[acetyl-CoA-carboxylase] ligase
MDEAARLAREEDAPHLTLVTATQQTASRGRQGKAWRMFEGQSFAGSFILREGLGPHLALVVSLAVLEACHELNPAANLQIKWPNDILRDGRKIAGILVEKAGSGTFAVAGIGLNVGRVAEPGAGFTGAFLLDSMEKPELERVNAVLGACVGRHLHLYSAYGWSALADRYRTDCVTIGQRVLWRASPTEEIYGTAIGLDDDGALMLKDESGEVRLIHAGEVIAQGRQL